MSVNTDQAIFDAIAAAVSADGALPVTIRINTTKFIEAFNGHRDRKLCTSLDIAQTPFHPDSNLPGCMMPDGGECCTAYADLHCDWHQQRRRIRELEDAAQTPDGADGVAAYERGYKDGVFVGREMPGLGGGDQTTPRDPQ